MVKKIVFKIDCEGEVTSDVQNAVGSECEAMISPFEHDLGNVSQKLYKDSYYQGTLTDDHCEVKTE